MSGKYALIIGNTEYTDTGLAELIAPGKDAEDFSRVLRDEALCGFDAVELLLNQPEYIVRGAIDEFFDQKKPDDLLILYFSGHGVRDELGTLYLAVKNTMRSRLRSTAIKSDYIREAMDHSRSRRQVLILDCCNSGAFEQGTKAAAGVSIGTASAFEAGYGRIILTASDSTQFAWEGDKVIGETSNSLFTHFLVEGLRGEADLNGDGRITVDELYDYAYDQVKLATPKQTPSKFSNRQQGEIILRHNLSLEEIKPAELPHYLISAIENPDPDVRLGSVQSLKKILLGKNLGMARTAREALEKIAAKDDSRRVSLAARQALKPVRPEAPKKERKAREPENPPPVAAAALNVEPITEEAQADAIPAVRQDQASAQNFVPVPRAQERAEKITSAEERPARPRTVLAPRTLYAGIGAILVIGLALWGSLNAIRNRAPETLPVTFPVASLTQEQPTNPGALLEEPLAVTNTPALTSSTATEVIAPVSTSSAGTTTSIAASRAYIYKGPALEYGLVVQKAYLKGETFLVKARNPSGLWVFGEASDGTQGWLYVEWVELESDSSILPTASYIPPAPVPATRRPNEPTPCQNFC